MSSSERYCENRPVFKLECTLESPGEDLNLNCFPHLRISDSVFLGSRLRLCISNKFSDNAGAPGQGSTL